MTAPTSNSNTATVTDLFWEKVFDKKTQTWGMGYSRDNGITYQLLLNLYGRIYTDDDAKKLYPLLKPYFGGSTSSGGTVTSSLAWADIIGKPDLVTEDEMRQRLAEVKASLPTSASIDLSNYATKSDYEANSSAIAALQDQLKNHSESPKSSGSTDSGSAISLSGSSMTIDVQKGTIAFNGAMADPAVAAIDNTQVETKPYTFTVDKTGLAYTFDGQTKHLLKIPPNDDSDQTSNQKIDTKHLEENNKPSEFPDGFSYALKKAEAIGIDRSDFAKDAQAGSKGLLTTKAVSGLVKQHFELLDGLEPLNFERTGSDDTWTDWFCMTSWN